MLNRAIPDKLREPLIIALAVMAAILVPHCQSIAAAYSVSPRGTKVEQHVAQKNAAFWERAVMLLAHEGVLHFAEPVHEEITARIYDCHDNCNDVDVAVEYAGVYRIAGSRWNDDPPFRLFGNEGQHTSCKTDETIRFTTQPRCWYQLFKAAKNNSERGVIPNAESHSSLLARSHFGDLQFLHSMASQDGELAAETQKRIMMWMEFTWRIANGEYGLDSKLSDVKIVGFNQFFGKSGWTVQDLFTAGNPALRRYVADVAFGSLLHTMEDSFAEGHVQREESSSGNCSAAQQFQEPPRINEFHSYAHQDEKMHKERDSRKAFQDQLARPVNAVTVARPLLDYLSNKASWETVKPYFECVFAVADPQTAATPGKEFEIK